MGSVEIIGSGRRVDKAGIKVYSSYEPDLLASARIWPISVLRSRASEDILSVFHQPSPKKLL
jgi:hypothetical protein